MVPLPLSPDDLERTLSSLEGWRFVQNALEKTYRFTGFCDAFAFMVRVAFEAEALRHHPDWRNVYDRVTIRLSTHDAGNRVTSLDVDLARRIEALDLPGRKDSQPTVRA